MKKIANLLTSFFASLAKARTASSLAKLHHYDEATKVILK